MKKVEVRSSGTYIREGFWKEKLAQKEREIKEDMEEYGIECDDWKEQLKRHGELRYDQAEMMENACMEFHKAIGKLELLAELKKEGNDELSGRGE